jgi:copper oxidase (laccase) domain-containing protein
MGKLLDLMTKAQEYGQPPPEIVAALGPSLASENFEVGPEFADKFPGAYLLPHPHKTGRFLFRHRDVIVDQLKAVGVDNVEVFGFDTFRDGRFFSCRRATQAGDAGFGLQVSAIAL